jgi:hypothetical protein
MMKQIIKNASSDQLDYVIFEDPENWLKGLILFLESDDPEMTSYILEALVIIFEFIDTSQFEVKYFLNTFKQLNADTFLVDLEQSEVLHVITLAKYLREALEYELSLKLFQEEN